MHMPVWPNGLCNFGCWSNYCKAGSNISHHPLDYKHNPLVHRLSPTDLTQPIHRRRSLRFTGVGSEESKLDIDVHRAEGILIRAHLDTMSTHAVC